MKMFLRLFAVTLTVALAVFVYVQYYSFLFSRSVSGEVVDVVRVTEPQAIVGTLSAPQLFSFAIAIKEPSGEIVTSSSEDRQWAVVRQGMCVEAVYYPYPPWNLSKAGTFYNARLIKLMECAKGSAPVERK